MAITVTSDQTLVNTTGGDAEVITNWTVTAAWSTAPVTDGDMYLQSTTSLSCIGGRASGGGSATMFWDHLTTGTANLDLTTGNHVFFWIKCITIPAMDARVRGGIGLSISSGTDVTTLSGTVPWNGIGVSKQWFLTGNDVDETSGWVCYVVNPTSVADLTIGSADMASVDRIGIRVNVINGVGAGSFKPKNILWDAIRYGTKLTITGSTGTFEDIYAVDSTTANQYGILTKTSGIFFAAGKLVFGDAGQSAPMVFTDTKQTLVWQDFPVASGFYQIELVGNTTPNVTTVTLGTYSGGLTSDGCTIRGTGLDTQRLIAPVIVSGGTGYTANDILTVTGGTGTITAQFKVITVSGGVITEIRMERAGAYSAPPTGTLSVTGPSSDATFTATVVGGSIWTLTASAANQTLNLYGCTFSEMLSAALTTTSTVRGCTFTNFGTITTGGALIDNCTFQDVRTATPISATSALIIASTTQMASVTNCKFVDCSGPSNGAIRITAAGSYDFTGLTFSGNTYDIENSSAGVVTINADANSNPTTYINTGGGSTSIINTKTLAVHVEDVDGGDIANAQVYIQKSTPTAFTSAAGNNAGNGTLVVTQAIDADIPQSGMVSVFDVSANQVMPYRYASWATSTFTLPTEVTGTADAGGSSTTLIDAAVDFTAIDVEEGDTVRNTTDGSWAVVDEIDSATQLTTSALQGGSDNTWSSGDTYSFHKLAVTLISAVDTVDVPLLNLQTDSNGEVSKSYNYGGDTAIQIRVRSNAGATKYIPFNTAGTIFSTGLNLNVVLQEDTEAT